MRFVSALVVIVACIYVADALSGGPQERACATLTPEHSNAAQTNAVPYSIDLSPFDDGDGGYEYTPGQTYTSEYGTPGTLLEQ